MKLFKILIIALMGFSFTYAKKPDCSKSKISTQLTWTNTASCHFDRMTYNYELLKKDIDNRMTGEITTGFQEEDANVKSDISSAPDASGGPEATVNSPVTQIITLAGSAVRGFYKLRPFFQKRLLQIGVEYKQMYNQKMIIQSAYRSPVRQAQLFKNAIAKYGSPDKARHHVAPPGRSKHNVGLAVDINMGGNQGDKLASSGLLQKYDCWRPMSWERWHVEPEETRAMRGGSKSPAMLDNNISTTVGVNNQMYDMNEQQMTRHYSELEMQSRYTQEFTMMTIEMLLARNRIIEKNKIEKYAEDLLSDVKRRNNSIEYQRTKTKGN